ncbi:MAG TPA: acyl carrier protein [Planctomycetota bacterium]|nr:acyl carrier protein [Planctomycetota bacterium]
MIKEKVKQFIVQNFAFGTTPASLGDDTSLVGTGIVDSTGVMELIGFLEQEFHISIDDADLVPENLDSINRMVSYVQSKGVADLVPGAGE